MIPLSGPSTAWHDNRELAAFDLAHPGIKRRGKDRMLAGNDGVIAKLVDSKCLRRLLPSLFAHDPTDDSSDS